MSKSKILTAQHSTAQHSRLDYRLNNSGCQVFFDGLGAILCRS